ncbi:hypothetical protein HK100_005604 [Physocladia obscura]|uniref:SH3 domain-containing protein n=1 Tax=Physocladia obscura TaxID=109957 RepID=A0AAD5X992_9FUNG|nr:hypothetical protein HK100_005604 [Physocladia obscura]
MHRMKEAKHITAHVFGLFHERATLELEYSRKLYSIAKSFSTAEEIGTMRACLDVVKAELETSAERHASVGKDIITQLEKPTADFLRKQSGRRKNFQRIIEKQMKEKSAMLLSASKAQARYIAKCKEVNILGSQKPGLPPKDLERVKLKLEKSQHQAKLYDLEYFTLVRRHNELWQIWRNDYTIACRECQKLEEDRFEFLRTKLWTYANLLSTICVADDESYERIRVSLESSSLKNDITGLIETRTTGHNAPPPLTYTNFHTGTSLRPLDALPYTDSATNSAESTRKFRSIAEYKANAAAPGAATGVTATSSSGSGISGAFAVVAPAADSSGRRESVSGSIKSNTVGKWATSAIAGLFGGSGSGGSSVPQISRESSNLQEEFLNESVAESLATPTSHASSSSRNYTRRDDSSQSYAESELSAGLSGVQLQFPESDVEDTGEGAVSSEFYEYDPFDLSDVKHQICQVRVVHDYVATSFEELTIKEGQILPVIATPEDGWWEAVLKENGVVRKGLFPSNYVEII